MISKHIIDIRQIKIYGKIYRLKKPAKAIVRIINYNTAYDKYLFDISKRSMPYRCNNSYIIIIPYYDIYEYGDSLKELKKDVYNSFEMIFDFINIDNKHLSRMAKIVKNRLIKQLDH
jgi:hypothetical protein